MKVTLIDASNQFSNISRIQPLPNRRNKKYKTSLNKMHKNGKTTLIKPKNFLNFNSNNNKDNSYENILDRIMDYDKENANTNLTSKLKKFKSQNPNINDSYYESNPTSMINKNNNIKLTTKIKVNSYSKNKKKKELLTNIEKPLNYKINSDNNFSDNNKNSSDNSNKEVLNIEKNNTNEKKIAIKDRLKNKIKSKSVKNLYESKLINQNQKKSNKIFDIKIEDYDYQETNENNVIKSNESNKSKINFSIETKPKNNDNDKNHKNCNNMNNKINDDNKNNNNENKNNNIDKVFNNNIKNNNIINKDENYHNIKNKEISDNMYITPKKSFNLKNSPVDSNNHIEEENEEKSSVNKSHSHSISKYETKNNNISLIKDKKSNNNSLNKEKVSNNISLNKEKVTTNKIESHSFNFTIYAIKSSKFCCF